VDAVHLILDIFFMNLFPLFIDVAETRSNEFLTHSDGKKMDHVLCGNTCLSTSSRMISLALRTPVQYTVNIFYYVTCR